MHLKNVYCISFLMFFSTIYSLKAQKSDSLIRDLRISISKQIERRAEAEKESENYFNELSELIKKDSAKLFQYYDNAKVSKKEAKRIDKLIDSFDREFCNYLKINKNIEKRKGFSSKEVEASFQFFVHNNRADELGERLKSYETIIQGLDLSETRDKRLKLFEPEFYIKLLTYKEVFEKIKATEIHPLFVELIFCEFHKSILDIQNRLIKNLLNEAKKVISLPPNPFVAIIPNKNVLNIADLYRAKIALCRYDTAFKGSIYVDGQLINITNGVGFYEAMVNRAGENISEVTIVKDGTATEKSKEYKAALNYLGVKSQAIISADKTNVLYNGLDNPISVSVPGFRPIDILASSSDSSIRPDIKSGMGHFFINPKIGYRGLIRIYVSVKTENGTIPMGGMEYRVLPVPKPDIFLGTHTGGVISGNELKTMGIMFAGLCEGFPIEGLEYTVKSYTLVYISVKGERKVFEVVGNKITPEIKKEIFYSAQAGDMLFFTKVTTIGPVGENIVNGPAFEIRE